MRIFKEVERPRRLSRINAIAIAWFLILLANQSLRHSGKSNGVLFFAAMFIYVFSEIGNLSREKESNIIEVFT